MTHPRREISPRILLVDDDVPFRRSLAIGLRLEGIDVVEAGTRSEALALATAKPVTLAMVNQHLDAGRGGELLEELGLLCPKATLIAVSCQPGLSLPLATAGRAVQLVKPVAPDQVLKLLAS